MTLRVHDKLHRPEYGSTLTGTLIGHITQDWGDRDMVLYTVMGLVCGACRFSNERLGDSIPRFPRDDMAQKYVHQCVTEILDKATTPEVFVNKLLAFFVRLRLSYQYQSRSV